MVIIDGVQFCGYLNYKGCLGSIEKSDEDNCYIGRILFIIDLFMYDGDSLEALSKAFKETVNEYLDMQKEIGKQEGNMINNEHDLCIFVRDAK